MNAPAELASGKMPGYLALIGLFTALLLHLATFADRPQLFVDEAVTLSRVHSLLSTGQANGEFDDPVYADDGVVEIYNPRTPYYFYAAPALIGIAPTITTIRFMTLVAALGIVLAIGVIAAATLDKQSALMAMLFTLISPGFVYASHVARPDVLAAALGYLAIAAYLTPHRRPLLAGFLSILAFSAHQRSVILTATLAALLVIDLVRHRVAKRAAGLMFAGAGIAALLIGLVDVWPAYEHFLETQQLVAKAVPPPIASQGDWIVIRTLRELLKLVGSLYPFAWPLLFLLLARPFRRLSTTLPTLIVTTLLMSLLCIHGMVPVKSIFFVPVIDLLFAMLLTGDWSRLRCAPSSGILKQAIVILVVGSASFDCYHRLLYSDCRAQSAAITKELRRFIPEGSTTMGEEHLWLFLENGSYISWKRLQLSLAISNLDIEEILKRYRPEYLLYDRELVRLIRDEPFADRFDESLRLPGTPFHAVLHRWADSIGETSLGCYGNVEIFKFHWDKPSSSNEAQLP